MKEIKAIIELDVPGFQIGQEVTVYFKDTMQTRGVCVESPIVRCKDCEHSSMDSTSYPHYWCSAHAEEHEANWFCADGEKED